jgi:hypothetical protein
MAPPVPPGDARALARNEMINTVSLIITEMHDKGLLSISEENKLTAAAMLFDKLVQHVALKVLAGMAAGLGAPPTPPEKP